MTNKPLPSRCLNCGQRVKWELIPLHLMEDCIELESSRNAFCAYVCPVCGFAIEMFQDTESGRRKFVPMEG